MNGSLVATTTSKVTVNECLPVQVFVNECLPVQVFVNECLAVQVLNMLSDYLKDLLNQPSQNRFCPAGTRDQD